MVKYFLDSPQQAQSFGARMYGEGNFGVVQGQFPSSVITRINPATEGPGFTVPIENLPGVVPEIISEPGPGIVPE
jgi:hypothetical protein